MGEWDPPHRVVLKRVHAKRFAQRLAQVRCPTNIRPRAEAIPQLLTTDAYKTALCRGLSQPSPLRTIYKTKHYRLLLGGIAENILPLDLVTHGKPVWGKFIQPHKYFPGSPLFEAALGPVTDKVPQRQGLFLGRLRDKRVDT